MSDDENALSTTVGQKRQGALQLGPKKKPYVTLAFTRALSLVKFFAVAGQTLLPIMGDISDAPSMHYALSVLLLTMAYFEWEN
jgi:hypothetical protein